MLRFSLACLTVAAPLALASCATSSDLAPPGAVEVITFRPGVAPFCGRCDSVEVAIASDGRARIEQGHWAGVYEDWRTVRRDVRSTPEAFIKVRDLLAPYRPEGVRVIGVEQSGGGCISDQGDTRVTWRGGGPDGELVFDDGCGAAHPAVAAALRSAAETLNLKR